MVLLQIAATTATISIGSTTAATEYVNGADVKTSASGKGPNFASQCIRSYWYCSLSQILLFMLYMQKQGLLQQ